MADALGWLSGILGGDPEAAGAARNSIAMQPAVLDYLQDVVSGRIAAGGALQRRPYDPALSYRENVPDLRASLEQAMPVALGFGPGIMRMKAPGGVEVLRDVPRHYDVRVGDKYAGGVHLAPEHPFVSAAQLEPQFRGQGVGRSVYDLIEGDIGRSLVPSPLGLTSDALSFWQKRLAGLDPAAANRLLDESVQIGRSYGLKDESIASRIDPLRRFLGGE